MFGRRRETGHRLQGEVFAHPRQRLGAFGAGPPHHQVARLGVHAFGDREDVAVGELLGVRGGLAAQDQEEGLAAARDAPPCRSSRCSPG